MLLAMLLTLTVDSICKEESCLTWMISGGAEIVSPEETQDEFQEV